MLSFSMRISCSFLFLPILFSSVLPCLAQDAPPIDVASLSRIPELSTYPIQNSIDPGQLSEALSGGPAGLALDLGRLTRLLDGTPIDPAKLYGKARFGPYPFEASRGGFTFGRFFRAVDVQGGKAELKVGRLLEKVYNTEGWTDRGVVAVRLELYLESPGKDRALGVYDVAAAFRATDKGVERLPWLSEGPFVTRVDSREPETAVVVFETDAAVPAAVELGDGRRFDSPAGRRHEARLTGLRPGREYSYKVVVGGMASKTFRAKAAPAAGSGPVSFAYCGDSREGAGGGLQGYMGVDRDVMERVSALAYSRGADLLVMAGDLFNGYTPRKEDFLAQAHAWKQSVSGLWAERPVYPFMGNHESLVKVHDWGKKTPLGVDRWPYEDQSAEAAFAQAFNNPSDGPRADPGLPPYRENVYTVQYGPVRLIALNNTYWYSGAPEKVGGSPDGFILEGQLAWLQTQLAEADKDPSVKYVFLMAHSPAFPCSGHTDSAMWHGGDNTVRAHAFSGGKLAPERLGVVEVRNRLARLAASSPKVAAVLGSDEHVYSRILIDGRVPAGEPSADDKDGDGRIDWRGGEPASPLAGLRRGVWYLTSGGAGAPYYSETDSPWSRYWKAQPEPGRGYFFSSQENVLLFQADDRRISVTVLNPYGERIDGVDDLLATGR